MSEIKNNVFNYDNPVEFIGHQFALKKERNPKFSLRSWSKQLGYENPSMLASVLKGERRLQADLCEKIAMNLKLSATEQKYFKLLVLQGIAKTEDEKTMYSEMIVKARMQSSTPMFDLSLDSFRFMSDWYHVAILEMLELKDFKYDTIWISKRLGKGLTKELVKLAIERLIRLGLVQESKLRKLLKRKDGSVVLENNITSEAIRNHHAQFLEFARDSIFNQDVNKRDIRGTTITLKKENFKTAQEILKKAHLEIAKLSCNKNGEEVYQLSTQFFCLTENIPLEYES
jgi:uncharacterized protein (TIGR02147 family)